MKKIMSILTVLVVGILVLSGFGVTAVTNNKATTDNHPPDAPEITGPKSGPPGTYEYTFNATDPDGDDVYYYIHWGDGATEGWIGPYASGEEVTRKHCYSIIGAHKIEAKAKDIHGAEGDWGYLDVIISKSKQMNNPLILRFLERFIECFLMLE